MRRRILVLLAAALLLPVPVAAVEGAQAAPAVAQSAANRAVLFAADGMRPDLVERYAAGG